MRRWAYIALLSALWALSYAALVESCERLLKMSEEMTKEAILAAARAWHNDGIGRAPARLPRSPLHSLGKG
jgi:predicted RNA polymerase sigma factor